MSSPNGRGTPVGNGYESPTEETHNVLFASQPVAGITTARPPLVSRASHMIAIQPQEHGARTNASSLNDVITQAEKQGPKGKVSIKDRIACHQWTYFTMVCRFS